MSTDATSSANTTDRAPWATGAYSIAAGLAMAAPAALLYWRDLAHSAPAGGNHWVLAPFVALGVWASDVHSVRIRNQRLGGSISLSEIPIMVGIVFLSPWLVLAAVGGGHLAGSIRQRRAFPKALVGLTAQVLAVSTGIVVYDRLIRHYSPLHGRGWLATFLVVALVLVVCTALVVLTLALLYPKWRRPPLVALLVQVGACVGISTAGALVAISLISVNTWDVALFAGIAVATNLGYRATVVSGQRYANLEKLYDFTRRLSCLTEGRDVMTTVLDNARTLLLAERAELVIPLAPPLEHCVLRCTLSGDTAPIFEDGVLLPPWGDLVGRHGATLLTRASGDSALTAVLREHGIREALVAPLQREDHTAGYLLVADRAYRHEGFSKSDLLFFETLTANAGVALRGTELLERLRREVADRQHQAHHDGLTGLPNRVLFNERLEESIAANDDGLVAVLLVDLDGFKDVNDTLGHHTGDAILQEVARRLEPFAGEGSVVARLGGDEFAVLLGGAKDDLAIEAASNELHNVITRPLAVESLLLDVRASVGVAVAPLKGRGRDAVNLVRHADIAMYAAKAAGGGVRYYEPSADRSTLRRLTLATELRQAIEQEALDLWYQPVVHLGTGEVLGCEALLRWNHEQFGPISPVEFIPVAENAGLIDPLTWWVLDTALSQVKIWRELITDLSVSVNLSARSLTTRKVAERVEKALHVADLDARALTLELTESSMMADLTVSQQAMHDLKELGVKLSIDDYGTGFSSLSRLKDLPFKELKIDRSFVKEMIHDQGDEAIVRSTIELARNLGRTVTAEGVEDKATLHRLASLGCHAAQGYYLAKPLPPQECEVWLSSFVRWPSTVGSGGETDDRGSAWQLNS